MKKNLIYVIGAILWIILIVLLTPIVVDGFRLKTLNSMPTKYDKLEKRQERLHKKADTLRNKLGLSQPATTGQTTPIQSIDKFISGQEMTGH